MSPIILIVIFVLIGASIGWFTNKVALYFLFHPKEPKKILFWTVQGIFPKRQAAIAQRFSEIFVQEFFTSHMIQQALFSQGNLEKIYKVMDENLTTFIDENLANNYPLLSLFVSEKRKLKIKTEILELLTLKIADFSSNFEERLLNIIDIKSLISEKIESLDSDQVNDVMKKILHKELQFIEISGAVLGGVIGFFQGILTNFI